MKQALMWCALATASAAYAAGDPPPADKVFVPSVQVVAPHELVLTVKVDKGYALYADRISVTDSNGGPPVSVVVENPDKTDKLRDRVVVRVKSDGPIAKTSLKAQLQGCSDVGVCYAPMPVEISNGQLTQKAAGVCDAFAIIRGLFC